MRLKEHIQEYASMLLICLSIIAIIAITLGWITVFAKAIALALLLVAILHITELVP